MSDSINDNRGSVYPARKRGTRHPGWRPYADGPPSRDAYLRAVENGSGMPSVEQDKANDSALVLERARRSARRAADSEEAARNVPDFARLTVNLRDDLKTVAADPGWSVDSLARPGHIATLPSPRKTGKTTVLGNLAWSGVDGGQFLGRFDCELSGNIAAINAEMTREDYLWTYRCLGIRNDHRITPVHCLDEGLRINLLSDLTCERFVKWLVSFSAEWLFLDPWKNFLSWAGADINDNKLANDLLVRIQQIRSEAGLGLVVIPMNTTQASMAPGAERAKGAGEVEDGADVLWRYSVVDNSIDSPRVLTARGRGGISMGELIVNWDPDTEQLTAVDGSRASVASSRSAAEAAEALEMELLGSKRTELNAGEFDDAIGGDNRTRQGKRKAAVELGLVVERPGKGQTKWYSMPGE